MNYRSANFDREQPCRSCASGGRAAVEAPAAPPTFTEPSAEIGVALELAFWESVKDSNRREELQAYLEQYPNGHFAGLAPARLSSAEMI